MSTLDIFAMIVSLSIGVGFVLMDFAFGLRPNGQNKRNKTFNTIFATLDGIFISLIAYILYYTLRCPMGECYAWPSEHIDNITSNLLGLQ